MTGRHSDTRIQCDPWSTRLQRWGLLKAVPFQAFDFTNVRLDEIIQIYRATSGEVDAIRSEFDITDEIALLDYLYKVVPSLRTVSRDSSSIGAIIEINPR
jgi:hypothetical protein